jgi:heme exporter protein D
MKNEKKKATVKVYRIPEWIVPFMAKNPLLEEVKQQRRREGKTNEKESRFQEF